MRAWIVLGLALIVSNGCRPCCVNECHRSYWLDDGEAPFQRTDAARVQNLGESANECDMEDEKMSAQEGTVRWVVSVEGEEGVPPTLLVSRTATIAGDGDAETVCADLPAFESVAALRDAQLEAGQRACLAAELRTELRCTDVGCGM